MVRLGTVGLGCGMEAVLGDASGAGAGSWEFYWGEVQRGERGSNGGEESYFMR